MMAIIGRNM